MLLFWILFLMLDDLKGERIQTFSNKVLVCHLGHYPGVFASRMYVVWLAQYFGYWPSLISSYNSLQIFSSPRMCLNMLTSSASVAAATRSREGLCRASDSFKLICRTCSLTTKHTRKPKSCIARLYNPLHFCYRLSPNHL